MVIIKKTSWLFCFFICLHHMAFASTPSEDYLQQDIKQHDFEEKEWKKAVSGLNYSKDEPKEEKAPEQKDGLETGEGQAETDNSASNWVNSGVAQFIMKAIIILFGAVIVFLLLRSLLGIGLPKNKKIKSIHSNKLDIQKIEENLHEANLEHFIQEALAQRNYALAIRLHYLNCLKILSNQRHIRWKKDKTNNDYLNEMKTNAHYSDFKTLTYIFEWVWYGKREFDLDDYENEAPRFKNFVS